MSIISIEEKKTMIELFESGNSRDYIHKITNRSKKSISAVLMSAGLHRFDTLVRNCASSLYHNDVDKMRKLQKGGKPYDPIPEVQDYSSLPEEYREYYLMKAKHLSKVRCERAYTDIMGKHPSDPAEESEDTITVKDFRNRNSVTFNEIIRTEEEIKYLGFDIETNTIAEAEIVVTAHFGNTVGLHIYCKNVAIISGYQNINNIGYMIKHLVEFFDVSEEDGLRFTEQFKYIPCRIVLDHNRCIGFGHATRNAFVLRDDFVKVCD